MSEFVKTIFDDPKLKLTAPSPSGQGKASLRFSVWKGNPRIQVWTGNRDEHEGGKVDAKVDLPHFMAFVAALRRVIDFKPTEAEPEIRWRMEIGRPRWINKKPDGVTIDADLFVGKDREGRVYLSVVSRKSNTAVKFPFKNNDFHNMFNAQGQQLSVGESTEFMAEGFYEILRTLIPLWCRDTWEARDPNQQGGGGNNNWQNNRNNGGGNGGGNSWQKNNNGGGGNRPAAPAHDDDEPAWA